MNLDFDFSVVSRFLRGVLNELRNKRLWPVVILLLAGVAAVPILLTKSSHPAPVAQAPLPTPSPSLGNAIPALNVESKPATSKLTGRGHDPFASSGSTTTTSSSSPASSPTTSTPSTSLNQPFSGNGSSGASSTLSTSGSGASTVISSPVASSGNPPSITPNSHPKPAPTGLTSTQSYQVSLAVTNSSGGLNTLDPLTRLTVLPSAQQPLLVELGVLHGGKRVLFALQPGVVVRGPGTCTPGPVDCEILSLAPDQTEAVGTRVGKVGITTAALFAVTGVSVKNFSSAAAATKARKVASAAGRALLNASPHPALALFPYEPSLGAIVDVRNLTVSN